MSGAENLLALMPQPPEFAWNWQAIEGIRPLKDLLTRMSRTPQDPAWHGEGDVLTHTRMVCEALSRLDGFRSKEAGARDALALAALLHDIGKIRCTKMADGRWVSPHHGAVGAQMARSMLWRDLGMCGRPDAQRLRESVCLLIRYHTLPVHLVDGDAPELRTLMIAANGALAPAFTLRSLCLLAQADILGRVADDNDERLAAVFLGVEQARESGCLDGPYPFASEVTQRAMFSGGNVWRDQVLFDDTWGEVVLLCGLPGTGKDTWIRNHCPKLPVVSLDDLRREMGVSPTDEQGRVIQAAKERARIHLRARQPFVWNSTSLTERRAQWIDLFESYHASVRIVFLETEWEENLRRNAARPAAVPEDVIGRMLDSLQPPQRHEARRVEWMCV